MIVLYNPLSTTPGKQPLPLSVMALAAVLEGREDWSLVDGNVVADPAAAIISRLAAVPRSVTALLAVTVMPGPQLTQAVAVCRRVRDALPHVPIVWGGYFPTQHADTVLRSPYVDFVVRSQGEQSLLQLAGVLRSGGLLNAVGGLSWKAGNQIVQGPGWVGLRNEMIHEARMIPLDARPHVPSAIRSYMGDSRGHWDGATLVVDTTNFNGKTGIGANGRAIYHSDALHVTERFTRTGADTIQYEATIDDPNTWTRPFTIAFPLKRDPGYGMFEYACHEGNYGLRNILSAARAADPAHGK